MRAASLRYGLIVLACLGCLATARPALAGPIYVIKLANGSIKFTNKTPPTSLQAQVFTSKGLSFSRMGIGAPVVRRTTANSSLFKRRYHDTIHQAASEYSLDPHLLTAVIHVESAFNPSAVSPKGAKGLMQLMPGTAKMMGVRNAFSPDQNIYGGAKYLSELLDRFNGNHKLALAAYNAGPEAVAKYGGIPPYRETKDYVYRVLAMRERYRGAKT